MAWTAELISAQDRDDYWKIVIEFSDGSRSVRRGYRTTATSLDALKAFVRNEALKFDKTDPVDFTPYIGGSIDVTPPVVVPPTPPTQEEVDKAAWFDDYQKLNQLLELTTAVPALATAQATTLIANLRASLEADWDNSYLGSI